MKVWRMDHGGSRTPKRRGSSLRGVGVLVIAGSAWCAGSALGQRALDEADDALERFLSQRRFTALQIEHLERRLASSDSPEARNDLARRLAEAYAAMVEQSTLHEERQRWTDRSRALIDAAQGDEADELRLSLAQARFRSLEQGVRVWRLRLDPPAGGVGVAGEGGGIGAVEVGLIDLTGEMAAVADRANNRSRALERQRNRAQAGELIFLEDEIAVANRRRSLAYYLAGWSAYHTAEIQAARSIDERMATGGLTTGSAMQKAEEAQRYFAWLLGEESGGVPGIDRLSDALLGFEHVARSALGFGLAESIRGIHEQARIDSALEWVRAIESSDRVAPEIQRQILTARVLILARGKRWAALNRLIIEATPAEDAVLPAALARLLVVLTLDVPGASAADRQVMELIRSRAIGSLISGGQLNQVLDLAGRFGAARFASADGSFIGLYAAALQNYQSMRDMLEVRGHTDAAPTTDRQAADQALHAAADMLEALDAPDADQHPGLRGQASLLLGLALFHASAADPARAAALVRTTTPLHAAAEWLASAAESLPNRDQAAYALWMAIRSMDAHLARDPGAAPEARQRREGYARAFIARFPGDDRAAALRLQHADRDGGGEAALQELLAVPPTSALYDAARRRAANMAFEMLRAARPEERAWHSARFLDLAEPLFNADRQAARRGDADAASAAVVHGRRMLEVIFGEPGIEAEPVRGRGERILQALRGMMDDPGLGDAIDRAALGIELLYREAQLALARNDDARAEAIADRLTEMGPDAATRGARLFYLHFNRQWSAVRALDSAPASARIESARRLIRHAEVLAGALERDGQTIAGATLVTVLHTQAEAAMDLWSLTDDDAMLGMARRTLTRLLEAHPRDQRLLRTWASVAQRSGDLPAAIEAYRQLLPALEPGGGAWFEIRTLLIEALAEVDPKRAREVINQHAALYPDFGPPPWGERLRRLHRELPALPAPNGGAP